MTRSPFIAMRENPGFSDTKDMDATTTPDRFQAQQSGKDWIIVDLDNDGNRVMSFHSRRGFPKDSLAFRAKLRAKEMSESARQGRTVLINGEMFPPTATVR